jgi:exopolyphosphatase/guanosine-5'-triphosphate,3'-diphosphate pyrophosphatase
MMIREREQPAHTKREIRGCIDLGSSNFRLLVVDCSFPTAGLDRSVIEPASFNETKRYVGWGDDLVRTGAISPDKAARAERALGELLAAARAWGCARPVIVATNTPRESRNGSAVVSALEGAFGVPIRVLSQREEAELGYAGASYFRPRGERITLIDAGGTSTEVSWGSGTSMEGFAGIAVGTHRLSRFLTGARGARGASARLAADLEEAGLRAPDRGERVYPLPAFMRDSTMLMTGGTAVSLAVYLTYMDGGPSAFHEMQLITRADVALAGRRFEGVRRAGRERALPLEPERIKLFPAGLVLIEALLESARIEAFRVTARDLRWGVVLTGGISA